MDTSLINHQSHAPCHSFLMMFLIQEGYDNHRLNRQASPQGSCDRSSHPEMFLRKGVLEICSKFTGEHTCQSAISIKLLCNFIEITLWHGCSPVYCSIFSEHLFLRTPLDWTAACVVTFRTNEFWFQIYFSQVSTQGESKISKYFSPTSKCLLITLCSIEKKL